MFDENNLEGTEKVFYIQIGVKKHKLIITDTNDADLIHIKCDIANINQSYLKEDLHLLFNDIEDIIKENIVKRKTSLLQVRLSSDERLALEYNAKKSGSKNISEFVKKECVYN